MTTTVSASTRTISPVKDDLITDLVRQGAVHAVRAWIGKKSTEMEIQADAFQELEAKVVRNSEKLMTTLSKDIKECLDSSGEAIEYKCRVPAVTIGCVCFNEKDRGIWEMSILDNHVIKKVQTSSGRVLAEEAMLQIKDLQRELKQANRHLGNLKKAIDYLKPFCNLIPVNLLMVVAGQSGSLRSNLSSYVPSSHSHGMNRALTGILLRLMFQDSRNDSTEANGSLRTVGATQLNTRNVMQYLTVPTKPDPCKLSESKPIHAIQLN
jgi:hypothetical protein